jgi:hypothetical protein
MANLLIPKHERLSNIVKYGKARSAAHMQAITAAVGRAVAWPQSKTPT